MCAMISWLFIGSNDGRPPQAYKENLVSLTYEIARMSGHVVDFNTCNKCLTAKLLKQSYQYHDFRKFFFFFKFYRRHHELVSQFNVGFKISFAPRPIRTRILCRLSIQGQKIMVRTDFSDQFRKKHVTNVLAMIKIRCDSLHA